MDQMVGVSVMNYISFCDYINLVPDVFNTYDKLQIVGK